MNAVARQDQIAVLDAQLTRESQIAQFRAALPKHIPWQRFVRTVRTGAWNNPELLDAHRGSYLNACMRAAQDGLLPDGRLGALVIYQGKGGTKMVQWLPMIAGLRQKVRNSGEITDWSAHVVHENDAWDYQEGDNPHIHHRPVRGDRGAVVAAYSVARYRTGEISREWMWIEEFDKVRAASKAQRGPWQDWTEEMYKKTVAKRHSKILPMSSDLDDLLRRPDEPDSGPDQSRSDLSVPGGVTSPAVSTGQAAPPAALTEALDALSHRTPLPHGKPDPVAMADGDEIDGDTGEVIDAGEYADSDAEEEVPQERTGQPAAKREDFPLSEQGQAAPSRKAMGGA